MVTRVDVGTAHRIAPEPRTALPGGLAPETAEARALRRYLYWTERCAAAVDRARWLNGGAALSAADDAAVCRRHAHVALLALDRIRYPRLVAR